MPRAPAFKIPALADLQRQLQYAPPETRRRQMDSAERLVNAIDPNLAYPREFVIFRITGYRPDGDDMITFAGPALRTDLANLIQRISDTLDLPPHRDGHAALRLEDVAARLGVSSKTIQRYRREGLVCHVVVFGPAGGGGGGGGVGGVGGERQLACYEDALANFSATRSEHLRKAARFTRMSAETEAIILREAAELRAGRGLSLNAAAKTIARRHGRAHETIRQMLRKRDQAAVKRGEQPLFDNERGPLTRREVATLHRAWMRGIDLGPMAERFDRSRPAIHRAITRHRAEMLRHLKVAFIEMPTFEMIGAADVILASRAVTCDLLALPPLDDAIRLLEWASAAEAPEESFEDAMLGAWNLLKRRAAAGIAKLAEVESSSGEEVDAIETDLRWATRLHRRLTLLAFPAAVKRIEANHGRSLLSHSAEQIVSLTRLSAGVIRESLEGVDPSRDQRLERVVAFAMERALAQRDRPMASAPMKAAARHAPGATIALGGVFDAIDEWETWLDPWRNWRGSLAALSEASRAMLGMRYGWDGGPPRTMIAIAEVLKRNGPVVARGLQKATRELRAAIRV